MAQVLVRDLSPRVIESLKNRAARNRRSLQAELRGILEEAAETSSLERLEAFLRQAEAIRGRTVGKKRADSAKLIRKDRER